VVRLVPLRATRLAGQLGRRGEGQGSTGCPSSRGTKSSEAEFMQ
jgi:hypothetical protein